MGRLFDEWKQKNAETGEKSVNDKACGELVHKRALLIFNPVAGEGRSLRLLPQCLHNTYNNQQRICNRIRKKIRCGK